VDPSGLSSNKVTQNRADDNQCFSNAGGQAAGNFVFATCTDTPLGITAFTVVDTPLGPWVVPAVFFAKPPGGGGGNGERERNPAQDEKLSPAEIERLKDVGYDIHEEKGRKGASRRDLYKDREGNVYVKPKGGRGPGEPLNINLNDVP